MTSTFGTMPFEEQYIALIRKVLQHGRQRDTRNHRTISIFGESITADVRKGFPILEGRKLFPRGVFGELAAMLRKPTNVRDFTKWGCNYWDSWADEDGSLVVDYGNAWHADGQIVELKRLLLEDPNSRRMLINGWRPDRLKELSLPCCHYSYQFYVGNDRTIHMVWTQRSVDVMIGLPSDMIFAAAWLIAIGNEFNLTPATIKMDFGDTHIYVDHLQGVQTYVAQYKERVQKKVQYVYDMPEGTDFCLFDPNKLVLVGYEPQDKIGFKLHA